MDRRIKLRHLEVFVATARLASLKRAADQLNLTQPAVSKTLKELEQILGHGLADRSRAGVRLTGQGELFLHYAEQAINALQQGLASVGGTGASLGRLRIGALPSVAGSVLHGAVAAFEARHPDTLVEVHEGAHADLTGRLRSGGLDLVVGRLGRPDSMVGFSFRQLYSESVVVVCQPESAARGVTDFARLAAFRVIYPPKDSAIRPLVARLLMGQGVALYPRRVESASAAFGRAAVLADAGSVWFISRGVVAADLAQGRLVALDLDTGPTTGAVGVMTRADEVMPPAARAFVRCLDRETANR